MRLRIDEISGFQTIRQVFLFKPTNLKGNNMLFRVNILSNIMIFKSHSLFLKFNYVNYIILLHKHAKAKTRRVSCFSDPTVSA